MTQFADASHEIGIVVTRQQTCEPRDRSKATAMCLLVKLA